VAEPKKHDKREGKDEDTTEYDNFQELLEQVLSVPEEELDKRRAEYEREEREAGAEGAGEKAG
jgi:hypothetical protein